jgi:hypothetical protein
MKGLPVSITLFYVMITQMNVTTGFTLRPAMTADDVTAMQIEVNQAHGAEAHLSVL